MAKKAKPGALDSELEEALAEELKEARRKNPDGTFVYGILDRTRVIDRCLKLEAIKAKLPDADWGSNFGGRNEK